MNIYFFCAGILCFLLGITHTILGEYFIFKNNRKKGTIVPSMESIALKERHLRILWATWHLASVFGCCLGALLIKVATDHLTINSKFIDFLISLTAYAMYISSLLVLVGTKGKHPGWIVLLTIGLLLTIGSY